MLNQPLMEKLLAMRLQGMVEGLKAQEQDRAINELSFLERLALLVDQQWSWRENQALARRLKAAKLRGPACVEDIDYRAARGLDKTVMRALARDSAWVSNHENIFVLGPTGVGKSFIASALAQKACRDGYSALYLRAAALLRELALARADGSLRNFLARLGRIDVLVIDDWAMAPLNENERREVWEICEDRYQTRCVASPCARNAIRHRTRKRNEPKPQVSVSYGDPTPDDSRSPLQALRRKVAGDVEDQLRDSRRISIDLSVGAGHDGHVVGDGGIQCVQGRDQRLGCAVGPQGQVTQCAGGHDRRVEDIGLRRGRRLALATHDIHRRAQGSAEGLTAAHVARVDDPARGHRIQRQSARTGRSKVTVDVNDQVGVAGRIDRDLTVGTRRHNRRIGDDRPREIVQG